MQDIQEKQSDIQEKHVIQSDIQEKHVIQSDIQEKHVIQDNRSIKSSFIPSQTFNGYRDGYAFKLGEKGQGYYKEKKVSFSNKDRIIHYNPNESPIRH
jgi:hypothetical protein